MADIRANKVPDDLIKRVEAELLERKWHGGISTIREATIEGLQLWLGDPAIAKPTGDSKLATTDPSEVLKTEADRELARALLEWWRSPEEDQLQAHLKRGVAAMLKIEHLLPASLQTKKR
jgi:hypothetical protein